MQNDPAKNGSSTIILVCFIGIGVVIGVLTANSIYHAGRGWFGALFAGIFCGGLSIGSAYLFSLAALRYHWFVQYWKHSNTKVGGVRPQWIFMLAIGLLMVGGLILLWAGLITKSRGAFVVGFFASMGGMAFLIPLIILLVCYGCNKLLGLRDKK